MKKILSGKVRDLYETENREILIVTTDRISCFDVVLGSQIPGKGKVLNQISNFWFDFTEDIIGNHIVSKSLEDMPREVRENREAFQDRTVLVEKLDMLPYEFIVRGYIFGSMWKDYEEKGEFCGQKIPAGYKLAEKLESPLITPSTKSQEGHDIYISRAELVEDIGQEKVEEIYQACLQIYEKCFTYAYQRGIIIGDTKFEFGYTKEGELKIADELLTPDSSRFWSLEEYKVGTSPASYDKQFVRDWLLANQLDGKIPGPQLPAPIIAATQKLYHECQDKLLKAGK